MPAGYVEPPEPLRVQVWHEERWLPGHAYGWRGQQLLLAELQTRGQRSVLLPA